MCKHKSKKSDEESTRVNKKISTGYMEIRRRKRKLDRENMKREIERNMDPAERIVKYFSRQPLIDCGIAIMCIGPENGSWSQTSVHEVVCMGATPNFAKMIWGLDGTSIRGLPSAPNPLDIFHVAFAESCVQRIQPFGGEDGTARCIRQTGLPLAVSATRAIWLIVDVDLFGFPTSETLIHLHNSGAVRDFCAYMGKEYIHLDSPDDYFQYCETDTSAQHVIPMQMNKKDDRKTLLPPPVIDKFIPIPSGFDPELFPNNNMFKQETVSSKTKDWIRSLSEIYEYITSPQSTNNADSLIQLIKEEEPLPTRTFQHKVPDITPETKRKVIRVLGKDLYHSLTAHITSSCAKTIFNSSDVYDNILPTDNSDLFVKGQISRDSTVCYSQDATTETKFNSFDDAFFDCAPFANSFHSDIDATSCDFLDHITLPDLPPLLY